ncbi:helix-turn-helix transcriptional regulator [Paraburkholderia susongensis]|uniref:DNA-binding transcriptional regulator, CsgD family n=1 Tax=Paraburkholderia susongensis TaxID=1515439 RepID=A0A1X7L606_9BURK|nr:LuxR C-terminal-related transcriptional regulator [Paraburkholderia susongensis]SMG49017.1 DNA-binding transcriptional regulator, CsgD family [Paraburkholderia susongensis]
MLLGADLSNLIASVYEAGLEPDRWSSVLERFIPFLDTTVVQLWVGDPAQKARSVAWAGAEPEFVRSYESHFAEVDPLLPVARRSPSGTILTDTMVMPRTTFERTEIYRNWGVPQDILGVTVANFFREGAIVGLVAARRPLDENRQRAQLESLSALVPHLQCATRMSLRLSGLSIQQHTACEVLDNLGPAILIVDADCRVMFANRAAEEILASADGIGAGPRGLYACTSTSTSHLRGLVARAIKRSPGPPTGSVIALERPSMKRALHVLISPLSCDTAWAGIISQRPAVMVVLIDPERAPSGSSDQLIRLFRLTPAEARVASEIGRGERLNAVAESLGVLPSTVRTHLHHVFEKTGTRRQAELVRLMAHMALIRTVKG